MELDLNVTLPAYNHQNGISGSPAPTPQRHLKCSGHHELLLMHHQHVTAALPLLPPPSSEAASQQEETSHQRLSLQALFSHCSHSLPRVSQTFQYFMGRVCPAPSCPVLDASVSSQHPARAQPHRESISRIKMRHAKPSKAGLSTWQRFREFLLSPLVNSVTFA